MMRCKTPASVATILLAMTLFSCSQRKPLPSLSSADSLKIIQDNIDHRAATDESFRNDPDSPFKKDTTIVFHRLHWFPIDPRFRGLSILHRYEHPETVIVLGTKGEERKQLKYGYFEFAVPSDAGETVTLKINVYKFTPYDSKRYALYKNNLSVWFTDNTTGKETYGVGRYVEIGDEQPDPNFQYVIDLNKAFNPYCAYSNIYSCAVPRKEDHLSIALRVGEQKYHEESN